MSGPYVPHVGGFPDQALLNREHVNVAAPTSTCPTLHVYMTLSPSADDVTTPSNGLLKIGHAKMH